jgi:hypothetical protein
MQSESQSMVVEWATRWATDKRHSRRCSRRAVRETETRNTKAVKALVAFGPRWRRPRPRPSADGPAETPEFPPWKVVGSRPASPPGKCWSRCHATTLRPSSSEFPCLATSRLASAGTSARSQEGATEIFAVETAISPIPCRCRHRYTVAVTTPRCSPMRRSLHPSATRAASHSASASSARIGGGGCLTGL